MKNLKQWLHRQTSTVWFACVFNLTVLVLMLLILRPGYETNDDISISMIANGAWGVRDMHVICQNYLLGKLYNLFYTVGHGMIPWYAVLQYTFVFSALTTVTCVLFRRLQSEQAFLVNGILLLYFGYECYIRMQYTKTAGIMLGAGAFLLFYEMEKEKIRWKAVVWGILLAVTGSLYRFEETAVCCVLIAGIGLYFLLNLKQWGEQKRKRLLTMLGVFGLTGILMVGCELMDQRLYASDPDWDAFMQYNEYRSNLTDYSIPAFADFEEEYKEMGISKTAYKIFRTGLNFYDPDVYSLDTLKKMDELRPRNNLSRALAENFLKEFPVGYVKITVFLGFLLLAFLWLFWRKSEKQVWLVAAYEILAMGLIDFYLYYEGRYLENRVEVGMWFAISLVVIWCLDSAKMHLNRQLVLIALGCLLIANQSTWKSRWRGLSEQEVRDQKYLREGFEDIVSVDPDGLYLAKLGTITYTGYGMFSPVPEGTFENVVWYGGWEMGNPLWVDKMAEYHVTNPYRDLIDQEHVYIVDDKINLTLKYIKEYYQKDVEAELVKESTYLKVYRIKTKS
ncbi:hypothetical protein [Jingyaoa shaoxingensis]|uniref:Glycosyltransferase RgtA/B/C/D-like domain-containing protein n=1 Tax=Jingyaoa shaoxingensis TaxID=2763671 RepID=A0ABR7N5J0_9FIRM|nr:hypothetical protein [Jingyaoa shaoxingensis]MBC8571667.1 hypothetical protein [Jingyaoa shaoxingensis]